MSIQGFAQGGYIHGRPSHKATFDLRDGLESYLRGLLPEQPDLDLKIMAEDLIRDGWVTGNPSSPPLHAILNHEVAS